MRRLCTLCARGGSKGVPHKNLRLLGGVPLIAHSLRQAAASGLFEDIAVSSDSEEILETARQFGATRLVRRPPEMATDSAAKVPAIQHCVRTVEAETGRAFEVLVDLDATAPLRLPADIAGAVALLEQTGAPNVITGCRARRSPYFNLVEQDAAGVVRLAKPLPQAVTRRQDAPACFDMNASIYVWRRPALLEGGGVFLDGTRLFEMPEERSIDIDTPLDFAIVEFLFTRLGSP